MDTFYLWPSKRNPFTCPQNCNNVCDTQNSQDFENKILDLSVFTTRTFFVTWVRTGTL